MSKRIKIYSSIILALALVEVIALYFIGGSLMAHAEKIMGCKL